MSVRDEVTRLAGELGFTAVRFTTVGLTPSIDHYDRWLAAGHDADMAWLRRGREVRGDPRVRLEGARGVVVLGMEHHHVRPPDPGGRTGMVARYAWGRDYHNLMGKRLRKLRKRLRDVGVDSWGGVDTAPILERGWANAAGLGFSGKNCVQILPGRTSWMMLAVLFVDADVGVDPALGDHCGTCTRCLTACPTDAFAAPHVLDSRRCIAYWTIESDGMPPPDLRPGFGRWVFGCDVCQEVCPHNTRPPDCDEADFAPRHAWLDLDELLTTPDRALEERFVGTPIRRAAPVRLKRNALIVMGNLGDDGGVDAARRGLVHASPVVRAAAVWALARLGDLAVLDLTDPSALVADEVQAARARPW